jgi:hypothetical protein
MLQSQGSPDIRLVEGIWHVTGTAVHNMPQFKCLCCQHQDPREGPSIAGCLQWPGQCGIAPAPVQADGIVQPPHPARRSEHSPEQSCEVVKHWALLGLGDMRVTVVW